MARKYDSSRREEAAQRTREAILEAAFELHGLGITDYETLAEKADVSLATVRKHFPNREVLFEGCTAWGLHHTPMPDLEQIRSIDAPADRLRLALRQTFSSFESLNGQLWSTYVYEHTSPVLQRVLAEGEEFIDEIVDLVMEAWGELPCPAGEARGYVRGLFSFLTYRALRHDGGLSADQTMERISDALLYYLERLSGRSERKEAAGD